MMDVAQGLLHHIAAQGWEGRIVPISHLSDLAERMERGELRGLMDEEFYAERLSAFTFQPPPELSDAQSIVIVAVPVPQVNVIFHWQGRPVRAILPPTYAGYRLTAERIRGSLNAFLASSGQQAVAQGLPFKTAAVCSGLAEFGRNNLAYVRGMGSFLQLVGVITDVPPGEDTWGPPRMLARCETCRACLRACPTSAITEERFLLHAERCLTFHNERALPFPEWVDPAWHTCLLGCMACQRVCPENKDIVSWIEEREVFPAEETLALLTTSTCEDLPPTARERLRRLDILDDLHILGRNLSALLGVPSGGPNLDLEARKR